MQVVVNKDLSIAVVEPERVYQGSSNADFLSVFAPFSISSYVSVLLYITLPNGELMTPRVAFAATTTPDGVGVWSMPLDADMTQIVGDITCQLSFIGTNDTEKNTDTFTITVDPGVEPFPPLTPSYDVYQSILSYLAAISNGNGEGGGGIPVVILQSKGDSTTAVMSQKAVTDELNGLDSRITATEGDISTIRSTASKLPTYNESTRQITFSTLDNSGTYTVTLPESGESGGGGTTVEVPVVIFDDNNSAVQYFDLIQTASGIYKARLLIYTYVPNCVDFLDEYYYISNLDYIMTINEVPQISHVSVSNCVLHSTDSKYSDFVGNGIDNFSSRVPLPLGDEIVFGKNESGYYIKPSLIGGENTYSYTWSSDWYVEIEFDAEQQLMLVNAYQCDLQKNI